MRIIMSETKLIKKTLRPLYKRLIMLIVVVITCVSVVGDLGLVGRHIEALHAQGRQHGPGHGE